MHRPSPRRIGILAGGRSLPIEIAEGLKARGVDVHIVAIAGEADPALEAFHPETLNWGQIGGIVASFKKAGCQQVAIAGSVSRPDLSTIKPDLGFFRAIPTVLQLIRAGGDDAILRGVIGFFEKRGLQIIGVSQVAPELLVGLGAFAGPQHQRVDMDDIGIGFEVLRVLAPFDVGQAVVVADGRVEAIEGAEGTDRMLDRLGGQRHAKMRVRAPVGRGILVKAPKPGQELRVDMPAIGPETVRKSAAADLKGIAVEAGRVLAIDRAQLQETAGSHRVFVAGVRPGEFEKSEGQLAGGPGEVCAGDTKTVRQLGRRRLRSRDEADAKKGARLISALAAFDTARAVVLSRRHVLAVEAGEGVIETIDRAAQLRQWGGGGLFGRRSGVAVLAIARDLDAAVIASAADAGLAGVAVVLQKFTAGVGDEAIAEADRRKLFIAAVAG
ncbi:MAG: UDP-2,3-diacylglucosamine diphosphatase LpxI [Alphaproteobacteria bacterium]|nr:UDP-2,3-diacylglucosamine diphosphatase LpxI [Alphaproteobacteria bacterium]